MQKRKFDELISHFNRKVSEMSIEQKYKVELLGMISAIGFAHEKELCTNLAEIGTDCISREQACDALEDAEDAFGYLTRDWREVLMELPPIQPKRGKWENISNGIEYDWGTCDKCKAKIPMAYKYYEFCPHCGAKMEEVTNA